MTGDDDVDVVVFDVKVMASSRMMRTSRSLVMPYLEYTYRCEFV